MILSDQQKKDIIIRNPQARLVAEGCNAHRKMRKHLYGEGLEYQKIDGYETTDQVKVREKYSRSNRDLFVRLGRPLDKVFSARGGSVYYNLPEKQEAVVRQLLSEVKRGYSARRWVETFWKPHMLDDPYGIMFLEILPQQEAMQALANGRSAVYPTYKSIACIYDYLPDGSSLEYVVFRVEESQKALWGIYRPEPCYRVVDDATDCILVKTAADSVEILHDLTMPNLFGVVPGILNSDIVDPANENKRLSFFEDVIELADEFWIKGSTKITHDFMHCYPKYWQYAESCPDCLGEGTSAKTSDGKCASCKGTGKKIHLKVSDAMLLDFPDAQDKTVTPDIAGYVSPDKTYYEIAISDLSHLEDLMKVTLWGAQPQDKVAGPQVDQKGYAKTATQVMGEIQPQADRLQVISEMAERRQKFIIDGVVKVTFGLSGYPGSSVNYGRRYMVESPDDIWEKYSKARVDGAPVTVLEDLLIEYYEAKYASDQKALAVSTKLMYIEPFLHLTVQDVTELGVAEEDLKAKVYFSEWYATKSEMEILVKDPETLRSELYAYTGSKKLTPSALNPPPPPAPEKKQLPSA